MICSFSGCKSEEIVKNGQCKKHAGKKKCQEDDCNNVSRIGGRCERHQCENMVCRESNCASKVKAQGFCGKHLLAVREARAKARSRAARDRANDNVEGELIEVVDRETESEKSEIRMRIKAAKKLKSKEIPRNPENLPSREIHIYKFIH